MQTLGGKSSSKPTIFVLPQENGEPILYKVDTEKMKYIRDIAEKLKMPDDVSSSSQSLLMGSLTSLTSEMHTDSGKNINHVLM